MKSRSLISWILLADIVWIGLALFVAQFLRYGWVWYSYKLFSTDEVLVFLTTTWILWTLLSGWMQLDGFRNGWHFPAVVSQVFIAVICLMVMLLAGGYLARHFISRLVLSYFGFLLFVGFVSIRNAARMALRARYTRGDFSRVVIAGSGLIARELAIKIARHPEMLCKVVGFLCPQDSGTESSCFGQTGTNPVATFSVLGIVEMLRAEKVDELVLALPNPAWPELLNLAGRCREQGINVSLVPQPYELYLSKPTFMDLEGLPVLQLRNPLISAPLVYSKRILDAGLAVVLGLSTLPILLAASLFLWRTKGRAFQRHKRCGQHGSTFEMFRLNIDRGVVDATLFERVLERLSITELPQLWNVILGNMSLVGPRPEPPDRVMRYSEWQQERLSVKPGMTGLAQVHGLREQNSSEEKTRFDLQYRLNPSLLADFSILLQTVWTLAFRVLHYSRLAGRQSAELPIHQESKIVEESQAEESLSAVMEEVLTSAHRSESGAD